MKLPKHSGCDYLGLIRFGRQQVGHVQTVPEHVRRMQKHVDMAPAGGRRETDLGGPASARRQSCMLIQRVSSKLSVIKRMLFHTPTRLKRSPSGRNEIITWFTSR